MKAIVRKEYGSSHVLHLEEIEKPVPGAGELLIKVQAASINWLDWHFLTGKPFLARMMAGVLKPKNEVLGIDVAGSVEVVGSNATQFQTGDQVFGASTHGCFAEYVSVSEDAMVAKPANITFAEAAAVPGAATSALHALRDHGKLTTVSHQAGQKVLINGASGGVGSFAVQFARSFGAEVTGICSTRNVEMVRSIGAAHVIDYTREDFTQAGQHYDLIFDAVGKRPFADCKHIINPGGIYVTTEFSPLLALQGMWTSMTGDTRMVPLQPKPPTKKDLIFIKELLDSGEIVPVIDRCYPLPELPDAFRYLETGHARGKVVITM